MLVKVASELSVIGDQLSFKLFLQAIGNSNEHTPSTSKEHYEAYSPVGLSDDDADPEMLV